ncbi:M90 family metallopeptidase [Niabella yanshanensis]|uniref:M90 family metallopeptidase n=1 Tax=Niabella yanshanensis TaxID=577386 RepID=A0ABZ0W7A8_9BACT|nr:M90 family metallopeptidase [Niabella yanshanensis]WQD37412.1 M90 family metallopeptidase [Niabella yanshanensis]
MIIQFIILLTGIVLFVYFGFSALKEKNRLSGEPLPTKYKELLQEHVAFYKALGEKQKAAFDKRVQHFLATTTITGVGAHVEDLDRVLIAASAVIPIFHFPDWEYVNLQEVLLYPETFNESFEQQGSDRNILGMVGTGGMNNTMILSKHALREGFSNKTDKSNTAIHEFVHLIDKTDGATDGIPEILLQHQYVMPWLNLMHENIKEIRANKSDINPYASTNQQEFLAVAAEYFFERPQLMKIKHPELYEMLEKIFRQKAVV